MDKKVIFLDVDGTLVNYSTELPESAVKAVRQARANGHKVYICTGRSKAEVYEYVWNVGFDGMIGGDGSYVEHNNEVVMHQLITADQCRRIVDWCHSRNIEFFLESNNGLFASENFEEKCDPVIKVYCARKGKEDADKATTRSIFPEMIYGGELYRDDLNKVSFILNSYQDHLDSQVEFPDLKTGTWGGAGEIALFGDFGVKGINKAHSIDVLLKHIGADVKDTFAFGDAKVDIPMLEYCAVGVAMGSGGDDIKAMADYVTDGVDEDGLYKAFVHFGLIEE